MHDDEVGESRQSCEPVTKMSITVSRLSDDYRPGPVQHREDETVDVEQLRIFEEGNEQIGMKRTSSDEFSKLDKKNF